MLQNNSQIAAVLRELVDLRQIIVLGVIFVVAWILDFLLQRWFERLTRLVAETAWLRTVTAVIQNSLLPLLVVVLNGLSIQTLPVLGYRVNLLEFTERLLVIWLIYRIISALFGVGLSPAVAQFWIKKVLRPVMLVVAVLSGFGLLGDVLNWGFHIEAIGWTLTVGSVLLAVGITIAFFVLSSWISRTLSHSFLPQTGLDPSMVTSISKIAAYGVAFIGVLVALGSIGIDLTTLTVIAGGLSVGLAFGLQEIVNNFISGFILLFERSLVAGNVVEIGGEVGTVQKIGIRSTVIKTRDNVELIIPNSNFLTEVVTNLTHTENLIRVRVSVGVSYNSNPREVKQVLLDVAASQPAVLKEPPPTVQFIDFGNSSLNFDLLVWTNEAIRDLVLSSDLRFEIWEALAAHNIEIPFPQRDLHIRSGALISHPEGDKS